MYESIISSFQIPGRLLSAERFGAGLINDTILCEYSADGEVRKYILQRINGQVFLHPGQVMQNVELVTGHIQDRMRQEGIADPESLTPALIWTRSGGSCHVDQGGGHWRMFHFIESGEVFDRVRDGNHAYEVGRALGRFQALVADLSPEKLHDTLPGFHETPRYLAELDRAVKTHGEHASAVGPELAFVAVRRSLADSLLDPLRSAAIPLRVVHNDPKVNNILISKVTGKALCMVDLDTVKPGIVHFDFGDCVRSAANPAGEDAEDLNSVAFETGWYEALTRGYLEEAKFLTTAEIELLPLSVRVITFELGIRFLCDHVQGDTYFRTRYPGHNLHRARVQFRLLEKMEEALNK
ncbi:MAG: aminoglycoside phosphotransferase family protein [Nitrospirota bacterium]|nr:aminoglycoside phosphotransferase family protein [Nitrospirota bacterium]